MDFESTTTSFKLLPFGKRIYSVGNCGHVCNENNGLDISPCVLFFGTFEKSTTIACFTSNLNQVFCWEYINTNNSLATK